MLDEIEEANEFDLENKITIKNEVFSKFTLACANKAIKYAPDSEYEEQLQNICAEAKKEIENKIIELKDLKKTKKEKEKELQKLERQQQLKKSLIIIGIVFSVGFIVPCLIFPWYFVLAVWLLIIMGILLLFL